MNKDDNIKKKGYVKIEEKKFQDAIREGLTLLKYLKQESLSLAKINEEIYLKTGLIQEKFESLLLSSE